MYADSCEQNENSIHPVCACLDELFHNKCEQLHGCVVGAFHPMCMPIVVFCKRWIKQNVWMD